MTRIGGARVPTGTRIRNVCQDNQVDKPWTQTVCVTIDAVRIVTHTVLGCTAVQL